MLSVLIAAHTVEENNRIRHQLEEQMHFEDARIIDAMSEIEYPMDI